MSPSKREIAQALSAANTTAADDAVPANFIVRGRNLHPEAEGFLSELAAIAAEDPANIEKLAAVVQEIVRMIRHDDIRSLSKGLPY